MTDESDAPHPTVHDDHIVSLIDGKRYKVLTQHLARHWYTAESYPLTPYLTCKQRPEPVPPQSHSLMANVDATLEQ